MSRNKASTRPPAGLFGLRIKSNGMQRLQLSGVSTKHQPAWGGVLVLAGTMSRQGELSA